jgi:cation-transporting P-type ATPase 13A2
VVRVPSNVILPCDLVILSGSAIVDESILTGESIPVMKTSLLNTENDIYSVYSSAKHTLLGGTYAIQTRSAGEELVIALVTSTGFLTTKGSLVRDILYPKEIEDSYNADAMKFVFGTGFIAVLGYLGTLK